MNQHDFLETTLPISAKHPGVRSLLAQGVWRRGVADVALAVGLALSVGAADAGTVAGQGDARFEPRRPAPVVGRVGMDAPVNVTPSPVSTAVQVPAPAHLPAAPHDLLAQPVASPASADGKEHGRVGRTASTPAATGHAPAGVAKRPARAQASNQGVSRETTSLAKAKSKSPHAAMSQHEKDGKARQALSLRRAAQSQAATHQGGAGAHAGQRARKVAGQTSVTPLTRSKVSQKLALLPATPKGGDHRRPPRTARADHPSKAMARSQPTAKAKHLARTAAKTAHTSLPAKPLKHGASQRSAKAASSSTAPAARRRGA